MAKAKTVKLVLGSGIGERRRKQGKTRGSGSSLRGRSQAPCGGRGEAGSGEEAGACSRPDRKHPSQAQDLEARSGGSGGRRGSPASLRFGNRSQGHWRVVGIGTVGVGVCHGV